MILSDKIWFAIIIFLIVTLITMMAIYFIVDFSQKDDKEYVQEEILYSTCFILKDDKIKNEIEIYGTKEIFINIEDVYSIENDRGMGIIFYIYGVDHGVTIFIRDRENMSEVIDIIREIKIRR